MIEGLLKSKNKKEFITDRQIMNTEDINFKIFFLIKGEEFILITSKSKSFFINFEPLRSVINFTL